jgi:hypothetical protein
MYRELFSAGDLPNARLRGDVAYNLILLGHPLSEK